MISAAFITTENDARANYEFPTAVPFGITSPKTTFCVIKRKQQVFRRSARLDLVAVRSATEVPPSSSAGRGEGFALILSLMLMAFVLLLLLSVTTLVRVETAAAGGKGQHSHAQGNALLALQIALGELQKYAGPDQRVSTTADLVADQDIDGNVTPGPVYSTTPHLTIALGARYWTAIWGNDQAVVGYHLAPDEVPVAHGNRRGMTPALLNWLVSGNEGSAYTLEGILGGVDLVTAPKYGPDSVIDWTDAERPTVAEDPAVVLVGSQSLDSNAGGQTGYVVAPLVDIESTVNNQTSGRYAWWVGDEGVKARVNLQNGYQKTGDAEDAIDSFIISQRNGVEFMAGATATDNLQAIYDFTSAALPKVSGLSQLSLTGTDSTQQTALSIASRKHFHNLTATSFGVLSDTYAGGLKKDLTADIADVSTDFTYRPGDDEPIFTPISSSEEHLPTWGHLRSWARTHPNASGKISASLPSDSDAGIAPVLNYASLGFDVVLIDPDEDGSGDFEIDVSLFPVVALYNPYPFTIQAQKYEVGFKFREASVMTVEASEAQPGETAPTPENPTPEPPTDDVDWTKLATINWTDANLSAGDTVSPGSDFIYFTVDALDLPPGESHIYYLNPSLNGQEYADGLTLSRAPDSEDANPLYFVKIKGNRSVLVDTDQYAYLRVMMDGKFMQGHFGKGMRVGVALAEEGGIDDPDKYYHYSPAIKTRISNYAGWLVIVKGLYSGLKYSSADILKIKPYATSQWSGPTQLARSAFRYSSELEGNGTWSSKEHVGKPQMSLFWMRNSNVRAPYGALTWGHLDPNLLYSDRNATGNGLFGFTIANSDDLQLRDASMFPYPKLYALDMVANLDAGNPNDTSTKGLLSVLFDLLEDSESLLSIGQLQHVPFSRYAFYTSYPFGNSIADLRVDRRSTYMEHQVPLLDDYAGEYLDTATLSYQPVYDLSYQLNRSIWDRYFLSTVPSSITSADLLQTLPNSRMSLFLREDSAVDLDEIRYSSGTNLAYDKIASHLLNAGAFNVNSTSEQAWRAVLTGTYAIPQNEAYASADENVGAIVPYARFSNSLQRTMPENAPYESTNETMKMRTSDSREFAKDRNHGNRGLLLQDDGGSSNDNVNNLVNELARTMVEQVRLRGPFMSLADFVNRSLLDTKHALGIKGAIQNAIDNMDSSQANPSTSTSGLKVRTDALNISGNNPIFGWDLEHFLGGPADIVDDPNTEHLSSFRNNYAFEPKYLTQADILSTLGPALTARSDTFRIRAYGESLNPVTSEVESRAWCEVIVQRIPDFVDATNDPETELTDSSLSGINQQFGRRFEIVSFRWLEPSEI